MKMESKNILLIEDSPDDVVLTLNAFKKANILNEMIVARDGEEALELLFGKERIKPAVVIMDLKLPKISGLEVLKRMRSDERTRLIPVVVLTVSNEEQDRIESYRLGANSFIRKPVDFLQFANSVIQLGLYWLLINEPAPII